MKIKKRTLAYISCVLAAAGSVITFYASNLIESDVSNMFYETITSDVISSVPLLVVALYFIAASIFCQRLAKRPEYFKSLCLWYTGVFIILSVIGTAATVTTGTCIYKSFTAPYPFAGATIICLVLHIAVLAASVFVFLKVKRVVPDDNSKRTLRPGYIIYSFVMFIATLLAFNRLGAVLLMPCYVQVRTLYMTWPYYLFSLLPMALLLHIALFNFRLDKKYPDIGVLSVSLVLVLNIVLGTAVMYLGSRYTLFVSAISPSLGVERLLTMPVDVIAEFVLVTLIGIYELIHAVTKRNRKRRKL